MDLVNVLRAASRHKLIISMAVLVGVILGVLSLYGVARDGRNGPLRLKSRSASHYTAEADLVVDTADFAIGRADVDAGGRAKVDGVELAAVYAYIASSEPVMKSVEASIGPVDVELTVEQVPRTPVIRVLSKGKDAERTRTVADAVARSFTTYLEGLQRQHEVPAQERVIVRYIGTPRLTAEESARTGETALLAFMLPVLGGLGLSFVIDNMRQRGNRTLIREDERRT